MVETSHYRSKIFIGITLYRPDDRFLESLPKFIEECSKDYDIQVITVPNRELPDAQNLIAKYFLQETDYDYLLFLEDDHWNHKKEMLDSIVKFDKDVLAINYYSRHFPYVNCLMREIRPDSPYERFAGLHYTQGFYKCDLAGFAMTLIKRRVFKKLEQPYFRYNTYLNNGYATDVDFSDRLKEAGIDIWGCFDYVLPHRDITKDNRLEKFEEGIKKHRYNEIKNLLNGRRKQCLV